MPREKISMLQTRIGEMQRSLDEASQLLDPKPLARRQLDEIRELALNAETACTEWRDAFERGRAIQREGARIVVPVAANDLEGKVAEEQDKATLDQFKKEREWKEQLEAQQKARDAEIAHAKEEEAAKALQAKEELIRRADSAEVASVLAPFLHSRDIQPEMAGGSLKLRKTFDSRPMSLSALQGIGALSTDLDGLKRLAKAGGDRDLTGPRWSVYSQPYHWSESDKKMLQDAQNLLLELGPTLVELGKLSP